MGSESFITGDKVNWILKDYAKFWIKANILYVFSKKKVTFRIHIKKCYHEPYALPLYTHIYLYKTFIDVYPHIKKKKKFRFISLKRILNVTLTYSCLECTVTAIIKGTA